MGNYTNLQKVRNFNNLNSPPADYHSPLMAEVLSAFGPSPETWLNPAQQAKGISSGDRKIAQARKYLEVLFAPYEGGLVEVRTLNPGNNVPKQKWFNIQDEKWIDKLINYSFIEENQGRNVFVGVYPREIESGYASAVKEVAGYYADIDFKTTSAEAARANGADDADMIVRSGGGLHCYFIADRPIKLEGDMLDKFRQLLKKKAIALGADPLNDLARVLRLPGTTNFKPERAKNGVQPAVTLVKWPGKVVKPKYEQSRLIEAPGGNEEQLREGEDKAFD